MSNLTNNRWDNRSFSLQRPGQNTPASTDTVLRRCHSPCRASSRPPSHAGSQLEAKAPHSALLPVLSLAEKYFRETKTFATNESTTSICGSGWANMGARCTIWHLYHEPVFRKNQLLIVSTSSGDWQRHLRLISKHALKLPWLPSQA